jgi:hypothetical protein
MSGSALPKTGLGGFTIAVGGTSVYFGAWQIAMIGAAAVALGIVFIRLGWRRNKPIHTP